MHEKELKAMDPYRVYQSQPKATPRSKESKVETLENILPEPYLPSGAKHRYTLVVDLDETLVHYAEVYTYSIEAAQIDLIYVGTWPNE